MGSVIDPKNVSSFWMCIMSWHKLYVDCYSLDVECHGRNVLSVCLWRHDDVKRNLSAFKQTITDNAHSVLWVNPSHSRRLLELTVISTPPLFPFSSSFLPYLLPSLLFYPLFSSTSLPAPSFLPCPCPSPVPSFHVFSHFPFPRLYPYPLYPAGGSVGAL